MLEKDFDFLVEPSTTIMQLKTEFIKRIEKEMVTRPSFGNQLYLHSTNQEPRRSSLASDPSAIPCWDSLMLFLNEKRIDVDPNMRLSQVGIGKDVSLLVRFKKDLDEISADDQQLLDSTEWPVLHHLATTVPSLTEIKSMKRHQARQVPDFR